MSECEKDVCPCDKICPLQSSLKLIGGKWKIPILCVLALHDGARYSYILKKVHGITDTMLSASLRDMERNALIQRIQYNEMPIRVEYFLSEKAKAIIPILKQLAIWGQTYQEKEQI